MSTIAVDATYSVDPEPTGIAVYSRRLVESLLQLPTAHRFLVCYRLSRWKQRRAFLSPARHDKFGVRLFQEPLTFWLPWQTDLFHSLAQRAPAFRFRKEIVTVFDIFPITGTDYSTPDFQRKFSALLLDAVRRAARVITASQYTAGQLQQHCNVEPEKISVVPVGVDIPEALVGAEERANERRRWVGPGSELVLVVGAIQNRKNTLGAVRAVAMLPERFHLLLAGNDGYGSEAVHDFIRRERLGGRIHTPGYVSPGQLESLYKAANVFLFPSFEEGFGIPVLEAMARGVPVIAAGTSSLPEVGGDAALYVNPHSVEEMAAKVRQIVEDGKLGAGLVQRGRARVQQFTWQSTADKTLAVYNNVLAEHKNAATRDG
ncbi:MAG TPA: glycosyltransferase family 1 protein [Terriglobia bacterium]|nr:glycosyltransferase family 1 protein [Terriglobia bacterium]